MRNVGSLRPDVPLDVHILVHCACKCELVSYTLSATVSVVFSWLVLALRLIIELEEPSTSPESVVKGEGSLRELIQVVPVCDDELAIVLVEFVVL